YVLCELTELSAFPTRRSSDLENVGLNHLYCTPNKLWEYPAAGVPILCSPLVEMTKIVQQYDTGWLLPEPAQPNTISQIINGLSADRKSTRLNSSHVKISYADF